MKHIFRLADKNIEWLTRAQGEKLRKELEDLLGKFATGDRLEIDFSGVQVMTPSFADECIGKLAAQLGPAKFRESVSLKGADETVRTLVNAVLAERLSVQRAR